MECGKVVQIACIQTHLYTVQAVNWLIGYFSGKMICVCFDDIVTITFADLLVVGRNECYRYTVNYIL